MARLCVLCYCCWMLLQMLLDVYLGRVYIQRKHGCVFCIYRKGATTQPFILNVIDQRHPINFIAVAGMKRRRGQLIDKERWLPPRILQDPIGYISHLGTQYTYISTIYIQKTTTRVCGVKAIYIRGNNKLDTEEGSRK